MTPTAAKLLATLSVKKINCHLYAKIDTPAADVVVEGGGIINYLTEKDFPVLVEMGLSARFVRLEGKAILTPSYVVDGSVQMIYVAKGSGGMRVVGKEGKLIFDGQVTEGDLIIIPPFYVVAVIADQSGMELFSLITSSKPVLEQLAGNMSVWKAMSPVVVQTVLNISPRLEERFRLKNSETRYFCNYKGWCTVYSRSPADHTMNTPYPTPITPSQTRIGWIGTGVMGAAMASRLLSAGYSLTIYARTPSKTLSLQSQGARLVHSPSEVAKLSDVVFTMLGHPSDVREIVLENPDSILSSLNPGSVIIDHTSSHPTLAKQIFAAAREKNCWSVDAPVSGGDIGARDGKLAILAAGDEDVVKWLSPLFNLMGKPSYVGVAGCGQSCKIANQITVGGSLLGLSEGLVFAEAAGLDKGRWLEAVRGGAAGSLAMDLFGERMIGRDFRPGGFAEYMVKDLGMGLDVVEEDGDKVVALPGAALCKQLYSGMVANGDGKLGTQGLITVIERINGK
ncbi:hypothetical protein LXL04_001359 [Taraxacum kok-saghyz]